VWYKEYLLSLREQLQWNHKDPKGSVRRIPVPGEVVTIKEPFLPRNRWSLARIVEVQPGKDGRVRSARVAFPTGKTSVRPVNLLCPLEADVVQSREAGKDGSQAEDDTDTPPDEPTREEARPRRRAAITSEQRTKTMLNHLEQ
jgi:hypothetical protein